jgi:hypothetical protein
MSAPAPRKETRVATKGLGHSGLIVKLATYALDVSWDQPGDYTRAVELGKVPGSHALIIADALRACLLADIKQTTGSNPATLQLKLLDGGTLHYSVVDASKRHSKWAKDHGVYRHLVRILAVKHLHSINEHTPPSDAALAFGRRAKPRSAWK